MAAVVTVAAPDVHGRSEHRYSEREWPLFRILRKGMPSISSLQPVLRRSDNSALPSANDTAPRGTLVRRHDPDLVSLRPRLLDLPSLLETSLTIHTPSHPVSDARPGSCWPGTHECKPLAAIVSGIEPVNSRGRKERDPQKGDEVVQREMGTRHH